MSREADVLLPLEYDRRIGSQAEVSWTSLYRATPLVALNAGLSSVLIGASLLAIATPAEASTLVVVTVTVFVVAVVFQAEVYKGYATERFLNDPVVEPRER